MKTSKLIFALLLVSLLISTCVLPTFAEVPTGRAGVNFAQINATHDLYISMYVERNGDPEYWQFHWYNVKWNTEIGGFDVEFNEVQRFEAGDIIRVYVNVRPDYPFSGAGSYDNWLLEYLQFEQIYYADAYVGFSDTNIGVVENRRVHFYMHPTQTNNRQLAYSCDGLHAFSLSHDFNNASVDEIMIEGTLTQTVDTERLYLIGFSILQNTAIRNETGIGGNIVYNDILYVPFNSAWFNITENEQIAYDNGYANGYNQGIATGNQNYYNEGYQDGAQEASGGVIQRWGAFLLTAVQGFLSFELIPGFPLWGLLSVAVAVPLLLMFLKMFAGG